MEFTAGQEYPRRPAHTGRAAIENHSAELARHQPGGGFADTHDAHAARPRAKPVGFREGPINPYVRLVPHD